MGTKLWGGRFGKKTHPLAEEFTRSIQYDHKLARYDVFGSILHVEILRRAGILTKAEAAVLTKALSGISKEIEAGTFKPDRQAEDIHTNIQDLLHKKAGQVVLKLHTARSRNDQVVFATKMYCKIELLQLVLSAQDLILALGELALTNAHIVIPGFTHMQHAQPVLLVDYLDTYREMLMRDAERLKNISGRIRLTMGAGALAGTPIKASEYSLKVSEFLQDQTTKECCEGLRLEVTRNALDAVSDRDFVIEILSALAILAMHLSRFAEDLVIWSTKEFDFVGIDEAFCTGSSLMPQKKNPDVLELVRGSAGRMYGNLVSVLTMMKGLPLTYNRDMQLDKEPLFDSTERSSAALKVLTELVKTLKFNEESIKRHLKDESLYATDLVTYLVEKKVPFKEAHAIVGRLVKHSLDYSIEIKHMSEDFLKTFSDKFVKDEIRGIFDPKASVTAKRSVRRPACPLSRRPQAGRPVSRRKQHA